MFLRLGQQVLSVLFRADGFKREAKIQIDQKKKIIVAKTMIVFCKSSFVPPPVALPIPYAKYQQPP